MEEIADGKLVMPCEPRTLYVQTGGKVTNAYLRWVIYVPFATPESTGLSTKLRENPPLGCPGGDGLQAAGSSGEPRPGGNTAAIARARPSSFS